MSLSVLSNRAPEIVSPGWKTCLFSARTKANRGGMVYRCFSNYPRTQNWGQATLWRKTSPVFEISSTIWPLHGKITVAWLLETIHSWIMILSFEANNGKVIVRRDSGIRWFSKFDKKKLCTLLYLFRKFCISNNTSNKSAKNSKKIDNKQIFQPSLPSGIVIIMPSLSQKAICGARSQTLIFRISYMSKPSFCH